jgi:hypothetical protein
VARAENKPKEALAHLEQAADMDMDNAAVVEALGEVAEQSGEVDRPRAPTAPWCCCSAAAASRRR